MQIPRLIACVTLSALVVSAAPAPAQDKPVVPAPPAAPSMPPLPQPGPDQAVLKADEGVWDATVEMFMAPGAPAAVSQGIETNVMGCGGMCLISEFKGDMMGMPFTGQSITAYDKVKGKYVGLWMDSMSFGPSVTESSLDAAKKVMTGTMEGPDMSGGVSRMKVVTEINDADSRVFSMFATGPDGKEALSLRITYKRRR